MTNGLPRCMVTLRSQLGDMIEHIERKATYGAVLLSGREGLQIVVDDREERVSERAPVAGTVLTAFDGVTLHEHAVGGFDPDTVGRAAAQLVADLRLAGDQQIDPGEPRVGDWSTPMHQSPASLSTEEKLERCRQLQRRARSLDDRIANVRVAYLENGELSVFRNRVADLAQRVQRIRLSVTIIVSGPDGARYDSMSKDATAGWESLEYTDDELRSVAHNALALLGAERVEPGEYTIITTPGVTGTICHESFGHGVETDMFLKERALAAHFIDKQVGSSLATSGMIRAIRERSVPTSLTTKV